MGTEVTLERYAEIRAEMEAGVRRDEALARAGLSADEWMAAQHTWLEAMGGEIARGRFALNQRYTRAFHERQRALTRLRTPPAPARALPQAPAAPAPAPAPVAQPAKPTFLVAAESAERPPLPAPAAPGPRPVQKVSPLLAGTMTVDPAVIREALPFPQQVPPPERPAAISAAAAAPIAPKGPVQPVAAPVPAPRPGSLPKVQRAPAALSSTSMSFVAPKGPVLPFQDKAAGSPAPSPPAAAATPALTLEQYASLCFDMSLDPSRVGETFQRYGLTAEQARAVDAYWKARVASEPTVREAYDRAYAAYRAWRLTAQGR